MSALVTALLPLLEHVVATEGPVVAEWLKGQLADYVSKHFKS